MNGGTSWTTLDKPPTIACLPIRQNWWTAATPEMIA